MKLYHIHLLLVALLCYPVLGAPLTQEEVNQIEGELGVVLSESEKQLLGAIAKPDGPLPQWRTEAEERIESHRKANLSVEVVDQQGFPVEGVMVEVNLASNAFRFGGVMSVKDFNNERSILTNYGFTTEGYRNLFLKLYNAAGLGNGFKPKLRAGNEQFLPGFLEWAQSNELPVRGHLLIWPGNENNNHLPADILSDVEAVEAAIATGKPQATIDALKTTLKANVDAMIAEWASLWGVYEWDVINETLSNYRVQELLGYDQMAEWFRIAAENAVQPDCQFLINEFQIISARSSSLDPGHYETRSGQYKTNINRIIADGGPLSRIGFQSRFKFEHPDPEVIYDRLEDFGSIYGLPMVGTEFEVRDNTETNFYPYDFTEEERARVTEEVLTTYYSHPLVDGLFAWTYMRMEEHSMCFYDGTVKLNGLVWYYLHRIRYHTHFEGLTDGMGRKSDRGFKGVYNIEVFHGGKTYISSVQLEADMTHRVVIESTNGGASWGKFPIVNGSYADTGDWLGWVIVDAAPWIWSLSLGAWLYIPESTAFAGLGWVYIPR
ncbi:MAG: endo-1,4-beta-xylanase [Puniceicoccaceae bacterium]